MAALDLELTPVYFAEEVLGISLYAWQDKVLSCFEKAPKERVKVSLCTPNGAGKSERIVGTLVLYWLAMFPKGKCVVTTKSGLQLDTQVCPAVERHQPKFEGWKFIQRHIDTPTGGQGIFFVTDAPERSEGHHTVGDVWDGPVLIIVDEAKSVPEEIFEAIDRCTYSALLYVSSTGGATGRFYESQTSPQKGGFQAFRVGLSDCPHIPKERIDDIISTYGIDHPITRSTLFAEWMVADGESRFNQVGLDLLKKTAEAEEALHKVKAAQDIKNSRYGQLQENAGAISWLPAGPKDGWAWRCEDPIPGCRYIAWGDPCTGEQARGSKDRDGHGFGIIRDAYLDAAGRHHNAAVVAVLHAEPCPRWDNDILCDRFSKLLLWYGDPIAIVEANNSGMEVLRLLNIAGRTLWRREKRDAVNPGKKLEVLGFQTTSTSKNLWIGPVAAHIREQTLECLYLPAVHQFHTFILTEDGKGQAQDGTHDDFVTGIGLGLFALPSAMTYRPAWYIQNQRAMSASTTGVPWLNRQTERFFGGAMS